MDPNLFALYGQQLSAEPGLDELAQYHENPVDENAAEYQKPEDVYQPPDASGGGVDAFLGSQDSSPLKGKLGDILKMKAQERKANSQAFQDKNVSQNANFRSNKSGY